MFHRQSQKSPRRVGGGSFRIPERPLLAVVNPTESAVDIDHVMPRYSSPVTDCSPDPVENSVEDFTGAAPGEVGSRPLPQAHNLGAANVSLAKDSERAIQDVAEGICPLCHVRLVVHDGRGCCQCCGDTFSAAPGRLELRKCPEHGRQCEHWEAVWIARGP